MFYPTSMNCLGTRRELLLETADLLLQQGFEALGRVYIMG